MNILANLLLPLNKLQAAQDAASRALSSMELILRKWDETDKIGEEIKNQTLLLGDIKQLLIDQNKHLGVGTKDKKDKGAQVAGDASKFKGMDEKKAAAMGALVLGAVAAVVFGAALLSQIAPIQPMQMLSALVVAGVLALVTSQFVKIGDAFFGSKLEANTNADGTNISVTDKGGMMGMVGSLAAILGMLTLVAVGSWLLQLVMPISGEKILTALAVSLLMIPLAFAFSLIAKELAKGLGQKGVQFEGMGMTQSDTSGIWHTMGASLIALLGMIAAVALSSWILTVVAQPSPKQLLTAFAVSLIMVGLAWALGNLLKTFKQAKLKPGLETAFQIGMATLALVAGIVGLVAASWILMGVAPLGWDKFGPAILTALILIPVAWAMGSLLKALKDAKIKPGLQGLMLIGMAGLAMVVMGAAILAVSWILTLLPDAGAMKAPPLMWSVSVGLAMVAFAWAYSSILTAMKRATVKQMLLAAAAVVIIGLAILGLAYLFTVLPDTWNAPPWQWSLQVGLALLMFTLPYLLITLLMKVMSIKPKDLFKGLIGTITAAIGLFAVAWIFAYLPDIYKPLPDGSWVLAASIALIAFAGVAAAIGKIIKMVGWQATLYGIVGIILVGVALLAIAWIFNFMPSGLDEVGKMISDALLAPVNGIVDVLARLKNEIGIKELVPLAIGIAAISVSLLLLAGATAGIAAGGVAAALGNMASAVMDGIAGLFGGKKSEGPLDILERVLRSKDKIIAIAEPMNMFSTAMLRVVGNISAFVDGMTRFMNAWSFMGYEKTIAEHIIETADAIDYFREALRRPWPKGWWKPFVELFQISPMIRIGADAIGVLAKNMAALATPVILISVYLGSVVRDIIRASQITEEQMAPVLKLLDEIRKDTYEAQANAFVKMAPALLSMVNATAPGQNQGMLDRLLNGKAEHPIVLILKHLRESSSAIIAMANPMVSISKSFALIGSQPIKAIAAATRFAKVLNDSSFRKQADALERIADAYESIADASNRMNIAAIEANTDMIKGLAYLSKNGGPTAVDKLGENLIKAIEEFGQMIEKYAKISAGKPPEGGGKNPLINFGGGGKIDTSVMEAALSNIHTALTTTGITVAKVKGGKGLQE